MTSRVSGCAAALAGMSDAEMLIAASRIGVLSRSVGVPETPTGDQTIDHLLRHINALDPIPIFLMGGQQHRL